MLQDVADACSDAMVSLCLPGPLSLGGSSAEVTAVYQQVVLAALQPHRHNPMTPKLKVGPAGARPRLFGGPCLAPAHGGLLHLKCSTGTVMAKCQLQTVQFVLAKQGCCKHACNCALAAPNGTMFAVALTALVVYVWLSHAWGCWQSTCDVVSFWVPAGCPAAKGAAGQLCEMGGSRRAAVRGPLCAVGGRVC